MPVAKAAIVGGALLLITRAIKAPKVYREIDGSLLLMFAGLFVNLNINTVRAGINYKFNWGPW